MHIILVQVELFYGGIEDSLLLLALTVQHAWPCIS